MRFFSDNAAAAHPKVLEAIVEANRIDTAYDGDEWSNRLDGAFSDLFGTEVRAFWVTTGTAANCLALAALCPPYRAILCHRDAHIEVDEAGAPAFYTGGAKLVLLDGEGAKLTPAGITAACDRIRDDVHQVQPAAISITNATEYGLVYRADEVAAIGKLAKARGLALHMDGARLANAVASSGDSLADLTWRAGVDALSFGFVKNGGLNAEALILFRTELADEIAVRRKRAGHLLSKGRYLAAQLLAMLDGDLWLDNARAANAAAQALARAVSPQRLAYPVEANELFLKVSDEEAARLRAMGFDFYEWGPGEIRFVTSWDQQAASVEKLAAAIASL
ncbi:MAG TPA: beta-eliminating lyase-related protein [Sphingomicrobium sp.]|nr:beta-eliminating lyase-related protein [Sphingomicrobium sp.]